MKEDKPLSEKGQTEFKGDKAHIHYHTTMYAKEDVKEAVEKLKDFIKRNDKGNGYVTVLGITKGINKIFGEFK